MNVLRFKSKNQPAPEPPELVEPSITDYLSDIFIVLESIHGVLVDISNDGIKITEK